MKRPTKTRPLRVKNPRRHKTTVAKLRETINGFETVFVPLRPQQRPAKTRPLRVMKNPRRHKTTVAKLRETINEMARLNKLRFESLRRAEKDFLKTLTTQHEIHVQESVAGFERRKELQTALRSAISLVKAARQNEWTPACDQEFAAVQGVSRG